MEAQVSEATSCDCTREDITETGNEVETSNFASREITTKDATSGTIMEHSDTEEHGTAESKCASTDETTAETERSSSLDREALNFNNSSGFQERPGGDGDCSLGTPPRIESDKLCENASVGSVETASTPVDIAETMADSSRPGSICIEMSGMTEQNGVENVVCNKISTQATETTVIYISEGDNSELETDVCRICHSSDEVEALISPCLCTGSVKFVHHTCLMSWLQRVVMSKCELCLYPLAVKRKRKPLRKVSSTKLTQRKNNSTLALMFSLKSGIGRKKKKKRGLCRHHCLKISG